LSLQIKEENGKKFVFDVLRKKFVLLSPEERVRQDLVHHLISLGYPKGRMTLERQVPGTNRRFDLLIYSDEGSPLLLAECKAPDIPLNQDILDQVSSYLLRIQAPYVLLTNGLIMLLFKREENRVVNCGEIPYFSDLKL
jgi:hypothetical protein